VVDIEHLDRDQLALREDILTRGIESYRERLEHMPEPNRGWLERELIALESERDEIGELRQRKFRKDVAAARRALEEGPEAMLAFLRS
jgi:uncharacterized damage-inducible protein DinB